MDHGISRHASYSTSISPRFASRLPPKIKEMWNEGSYWTYSSFDLSHVVSVPVRSALSATSAPADGIMSDFRYRSWGGSSSGIVEMYQISIARSMFCSAQLRRKLLNCTSAKMRWSSVRRILS